MSTYVSDARVPSPRAVYDAVMGITGIDAALKLASVNAVGSKVYLVGGSLARVLSRLVRGSVVRTPAGSCDVDILVDSFRPKIVKPEQWAVEYNPSPGGEVPIDSEGRIDAREFSGSEDLAVRFVYRGGGALDGLQVDVMSLGKLCAARGLPVSFESYARSVPLSCQALGFDLSSSARDIIADMRHHRQRLVGVTGVASVLEGRVWVNDESSLAHAAARKKVSPVEYAQGKADALGAQLLLPRGLASLSLGAIE